MPRADIPFIITIDTEGDNLWARPRQITTRNAEFLPRFQALCERHGFKPVYLTNHEMAHSDAFVEFGRDVIARGTGEIGMHLHAWNSPPMAQLTSDDFLHQPYLIEYPDHMMREKIRALTGLLEERFGQQMVSHRAGRWAFDARYAAMLLAEGYRVDCSVTPGIDWRANPGKPGGDGGTDYRKFPQSAYFMQSGDISRSAGTGLLEVPMTIKRGGLSEQLSWSYQVPLIRRIANSISPETKWLSPVQPSIRASLARNLDTMLGEDWAASDASHLEFMLHSSELMPGGSPGFRTDKDIDLLYEGMETLFTRLRNHCRGMTLREFHAARLLELPIANACGALKTTHVHAGA